MIPKRHCPRRIRLRAKAFSRKTGQAHHRDQDFRLERAFPSEKTVPKPLCGPITGPVVAADSDLNTPGDPEPPSADRTPVPA